MPSSLDRQLVTLALTEKGQEMAVQIQAIQAEMDQRIDRILESATAPVPEMMKLLWKFIEGQPAGEALAR